MSTVCATWMSFVYMSKMDLISNYMCFHSLESMASQDKDTLKKLYGKEKLSSTISRCRLCNCVALPKHSKDLFRKQNKDILCKAEVFMVLICQKKANYETEFAHHVKDG